jgi:serine protease SohB
MEFLTEYGLFLAKTITVVIAVLVVVGGVIALSTRAHPKPDGHIEVKHLNGDFEDWACALQQAMLSRKAFKRLLKTKKKLLKQQLGQRARVFVLNFRGDIRASAVASLRREITAILSVVKPEDEVVLRLESSGGLVHNYGLAASQLGRIKESKIKLTVAVDKVAASGGYMMACVADQIIAAPFAVLGSIGVIAQLPNFNRLLKKNDIDFEQFTAGEYKRTITFFGENTDRAREKFREELEDTHTLFKDFVKAHRNDVDLSRVATGEHWYGTRALELKLVDELRTSDDHLMVLSQNADLFEVSYTRKHPLVARLFSFVSQSLVRLLANLKVNAGWG